MYKLSLIPHSDISGPLLDEVIRLKTISWPYSYEDQLRWIRNNLKDSDIHVLLSLDDRHVGYLNLIRINLTINGHPAEALGVGNVCTEVRGNGYGKELMLLTNNVIRKYKTTGLLFCRDRLINFYAACKWEKIDNSKVKVGFDCSSIVIMTFNIHEPVQQLEYTGKLF